MSSSEKRIRATGPLTCYATPVVSTPRGRGLRWRWGQRPLGPVSILLSVMPPARLKSQWILDLVVGSAHLIQPYI